MSVNSHGEKALFQSPASKMMKLHFTPSHSERTFPSVPLLDGNEGTVRQLRRRLAAKNLLAPADAEGGVELLSSGGGEAVGRMKALLEAAL